MLSHSGIFIKSSIPRHNKILMLDLQEGLIEIVVPRKLSNIHQVVGALCTYYLVSWREKMIFETFDMIAYPLHYTNEELLFFHHVLEMILFFAPPSQSIPEIFELLLLLYNPETRSFLNTRFTQQLFLCKFFSLLGVYPEEKAYRQSTHMQRLILLPLDIMVKNANERIMTTFVHNWVLACIHSHSQVELFKTVLWYDK